MDSDWGERRARRKERLGGEAHLPTHAGSHVGGPTEPKQSRTIILLFFLVVYRRCAYTIEFHLLLYSICSILLMYSFILIEMVALKYLLYIPCRKKKAKFTPDLLTWRAVSFWSTNF